MRAYFARRQCVRSWLARVLLTGHNPQAAPRRILRQIAAPFARPSAAPASCWQRTPATPTTRACSSHKLRFSRAPLSLRTLRAVVDPSRWTRRANAMKSALRNETARKRERERAREMHDQDEDECPVCMTAYGRSARTERARVVFPCGHAVCRACDGNMRTRGFHSCPTCRTPREGFSQAQVDLAAQARTLADAEADGEGPQLTAWAVHVDGNQGAFEAFLQSHGEPLARPRGGVGNGWQIMFFPNESQGDPFAALRLAAGGGGVAQGSGSTGNGVTVARRRRHSARQRQRHDDGGGDLDEADANEDEDTSRPAVPTTTTEGDARARPLLDAALQDLIYNHLLQPSDLSTFLAHHRALTQATPR